MKWVVTAVLVCCAAANAQVLNQGSASKLQPYQFKALENGLGISKAPAKNNPFGPWVKLPPPNTPAVLPTRASVQVLVDGACAIPLLSAHVNSEMDSGIHESWTRRPFLLTICRSPTVYRSAGRVANLLAKLSIFRSSA